MPPWTIAGGSCVLNAGETGSCFRLTTTEESSLPISVIVQRFDVNAGAVDATNTDTPIVASVLFGASRTGDRIEFDVENGAILTVPWGNVEVSATFERDPQAGAVQPQQRVTATAFAGARPGGTRPTRQRRLGVVVAGARTYVPVPAYAVDVTVYGSPQADVYASGMVLSAARAPGGRVLAEWPVTGPNPVRLPNGTRAILVALPGVAMPVITLEFGLCL